jgi:hypothetical protein
VRRDRLTELGAGDAVALARVLEAPGQDVADDRGQDDRMPTDRGVAAQVRGQVDQPSLLAYIGHPAYGLDALRADLDRFAFLLGGNDGEFLLGEDLA